MRYYVTEPLRLIQSDYAIYPFDNVLLASPGQVVTEEQYKQWQEQFIEPSWVIHLEDYPLVAVTISSNSKNYNELIKSIVFHTKIKPFIHQKNKVIFLFRKIIDIDINEEDYCFSYSKRDTDLTLTIQHNDIITIITANEKAWRNTSDIPTPDKLPIYNKEYHSLFINWIKDKALTLALNPVSTMNTFKPYSIDLHKFIKDELADNTDISRIVKNVYRISKNNPRSLQLLLLLCPTEQKTKIVDLWSSLAAQGQLFQINNLIDSDVNELLTSLVFVEGYNRITFSDPKKAFQLLKIKDLSIQLAGKYSSKMINYWLHHPRRINVQDIIYVPVNKRFVQKIINGMPIQYLNKCVMPDWIKPDEEQYLSAISLFNKHIDYLTGGDTFLLDYMADMVQNPQHRPTISLLHISLHHGTGRQWLVLLMQAIFGMSNIQSASIDDLNRSHHRSSFFMDNLALCFNEFKDTKSQVSLNESMRDLLTSPTLLNAKKQAQEIFTRVFFFANQYDCIELSSEDRRIHVTVNAKRPLEPDHYQTLYAQLDKPEFIAAIYYYLKNRVYQQNTLFFMVEHPGRQWLINKNSTPLMVALYEFKLAIGETLFTLPLLLSFVRIQAGYTRNRPLPTMVTDNVIKWLKETAQSAIFFAEDKEMVFYSMGNIDDTSLTEEKIKEQIHIANKQLGEYLLRPKLLFNNLFKKEY